MKSFLEWVLDTVHFMQNKQPLSQKVYLFRTKKVYPSFQVCT